MKNSLLLLLIILLGYSCTPNVARIDNSLQKFFDSARIEGSFAMFDNQRGDVTVYNMKMDTLRMDPGAIFKIPETLIGFETSKISNQNSRMKTSDTVLAKVSLKEAFENNNRAYFNLLDSAVGAGEMRFWLDSLQYGNADIKNTTEFWKDGQLAISPDEQLGLLFKLYFDKLPFQKYAQGQVRDLMLKEDNTEYKYSYTSGVSEKDGLAWMLGWIEENRHVFFFAATAKREDALIDIENKLQKVTRDILVSKGFFEGKK